MARFMQFEEIDRQGFRGRYETGADGERTVKVLPNVNPQKDNQLKITAEGLYVAPPPTLQVAKGTTQIYNPILMNGISPNRATNVDNQVYLAVRNGFGHLKLDVKRTAANTSNIIGELPDTAPTPDTMIEEEILVTQTAGARVWIGKNSRTIYGTGFTLNRRFTFNLYGHFSEML